MLDSAGGAQRREGADPLERPADGGTIGALYSAGLLSAEARNAAIGMFRPPLAWWRWVSRALLFLGAALVLAGVVFFFACNWAGMGPFLKFGLIQFLLIACVAGVWFVGIERVVGKVILMGAAVLVGALFAVYGQTYQTGADAYELFAAWAAFILGWVIVSRFCATWLMWLVLVNLSVTLYWGQVLLPNQAASFASMCVLLALVNGAALVGREYGVLRGMEWLAERWFRWVLLLAVLTYLIMPTVAMIVEEDRRHAMSTLSAFMLVGGVAFACWYYRYRSPDLFALTLCAQCACVVVVTLVGKWWFALTFPATPHDLDSIIEFVFLLIYVFLPSFLPFALLVLGVVSLAALWLRRAGRAMKEETGG